MTLDIPDAPFRRTMSVWIAAVTALVMAAAVLVLTPTRAHAATAVPLGTAGDFGVLAGSTVTNTGPSVIQGNVGVSPGSAIVGFPPGQVLAPGVFHPGDATALGAQNDLTIAYGQAAGQTPPTATYLDNPHEFGGQTLTPGLYKANVSAGITNTLTLDALGNPNAVWVFQIGSTLTTASASHVSFINGASPCNVYWQIGSSATLGTNSSFVGNILAQASITATTNAVINGRLLARTGAVTLDTNTIFQGGCAAGTGGSTGTNTGGATTGAIGGVIGGVIGGIVAGTTTNGGTTGTNTGGNGGVIGGGNGGVIGGGNGGGNGGVIGGGNGGANGGGGNGGPGHHHPGGQPGRPGDHDHGGQPGEHHGHDHGGQPGEHHGQDHGGKPGENHGHDEHSGKPGKPGKHDSYGGVRS
ncbi:ice-binding family protein [Streptomyces avermitilis]